MDRVRVRVFVRGRVQGVYFRESTRVQAEKLSLSGWVRNLSDGRVEALIEGPEAAAAALVEYMRRGPTLARVDQLEFGYEEPSGDLGPFSVERRG